MTAVPRILVATLAALTLSACWTPPGPPVGGNDEGAPQGNPATYQRINSLTDCVALQAEFDRFERAHRQFIDSRDLGNAEVATDYMATVDDRMRIVGCYR